jgi:hypothetical protein
LRYSRRGGNGREQSRVTSSIPKSVESKTIPFGQRLTCTISEACEVTGLGRTKLYELMGTGQLATTTVGCRRLVLVRSLQALLDVNSSEAGQMERGFGSTSLGLTNLAVIVHLLPLQSARGGAAVGMLAPSSTNYVKVN